MASGFHVRCFASPLETLLSAALDWRFLHRDLEALSLPFPHDVDLHLLADRDARHPPRELAEILHRLAVHRHDHVTTADAGALRRAAAIEVSDERAVAAAETERVCQLGRQVLHRHAEPGTNHAAVS